MRTLTDVLSKVKVKFKRPVDMAGGVLLSLLDRLRPGGLHHDHAPHGPAGAEFSGWRIPADARLRGCSSAWRRITTGSASCAPKSEGPFSRSRPQNDPSAHVFDPDGDFILKYAQRRANFEKELGSRVK